MAQSGSRSGDMGGSRPAPFFDQGLFLLHLNRGKEEMRKGRWDAARSELLEARRYRPRDGEVLANLAFAHFHLGDLADAERLTREVLSTHAGSAPLLFNLGLILFKSGRIAEAREPLEKVLAIVPGHRKAHLTLGLVLQRLGQTDRAKEHLRSAGADRRAGADGDDTVSRAARAATHEAPQPGRDGREETSPIVKPESFAVSGVVPRTLPGPSPSASASAVPRPDEARSADAAESAAEPSTAPVVRPASVALSVDDATAGAQGPFLPAAGGFLAASSERGILFARAALAGRRGLPLVSPVQGDGAVAPLLSRATGEGTLLLVSRGRRPWLTRLSGGFLSVDPERLLAFEASLLWREDPAFELRRIVSLPFVKLLGEGEVALAVRAEPALFEVTEAEPLTIAAASVAGYSGAPDVELLEDVDPATWGPGPVLRFTGTGTVLADA